MGGLHSCYLSVGPTLIKHHIWFLNWSDIIFDIKLIKHHIWFLNWSFNQNYNFFRFGKRSAVENMIRPRQYYWTFPRDWKHNFPWTLPCPIYPCTLEIFIWSKGVMQGKLFQSCTHLLYCSVLSLGGNVNTRRMSQSDTGSIFHIKNQWNILVIGNYYVDYQNYQN